MGQPHGIIKELAESRSIAFTASAHPVERGHTNEITHGNVDSRRTGGVCNHYDHQEAAGTGGSREDDGMGVSDVRLVDAKTGKWRFISHRFD